MNWVPLVVGAVVTLFMFAGHALMQRLSWRGTAMRRDLAEGNTARALAEAGDVLGIALVAAAVTRGCSRGEDVVQDLAWAGLYGSVALVLLEFASTVGMRMLVQSRLRAEVERGNAAAGVAAAGHALSTALLIAANVHGTEAAMMPVSIGFFVVGQAALYAFTIGFRALTAYDDAEEILGENTAAALSYAGAMVGIALVGTHASDGEFDGWIPSLVGYAGTLAWVLLFWPVRQLLVQGVLLGGRPTLRGGRLDEEIARDRNVGMGALEAVAYVATALLVQAVGG